MPALTGPVWRIHRRQPVQPTTRSSSGGGKKFGHIPHFIEVPRYVPHTAGIIEMVDEPSHLVRELFRRHRRGRTTRGVLDGPDDPLAADQGGRHPARVGRHRRVELDPHSPPQFLDRRVDRALIAELRRPPGIAQQPDGEAVIDRELALQAGRRLGDSHDVEHAGWTSSTTSAMRSGSVTSARSARPVSITGWLTIPQL